MASINVLEALENEMKKYPSIKVEREDNLNYDLGNLLAFDPKPYDQSTGDINTDLQATARDNVQLLFNKIWDLPTTRNDDGIFAILPEPTTQIPREKHVPKPKPLTKWERFAKDKGIKKKTKGRLVYDEKTGDLRPRYGFKGANQDGEWAIEAKPDDDPTSDPFEKKTQEKKERVKKQQERQLANTKRALKAQRKESSLPATISITSALKPPIPEAKAVVHDALSVAQKSTISMGRFDKRLRDEEPVKVSKKVKISTESAGSEKERNMKVLDKMLTKSERNINIEKATNRAISSQQQKRSTKTKKVFKKKS